MHFIKFALRNRNPSYPSNKSRDKMVIIYQWSFKASEPLQNLLFWLVGFEKSNFNAGKWYFSCLKAFLFLTFSVFFTFCGFIKNMFTHKAPLSDCVEKPWFFPYSGHDWWLYKNMQKTCRKSICVELNGTSFRSQNDNTCIEYPSYCDNSPTRPSKGGIYHALYDKVIWKVNDQGKYMY